MKTKPLSFHRFALLRSLLLAFGLVLTHTHAQSPALSIDRDAGRAKVGLTGTMGREYLLEAVDNLSTLNDWLPVAFFSLTNSSTDWLDFSSATQSQRFYRVSDQGGTRPAIILGFTNLTVIPGSAPNLSWQVTGAANNLELLIRVREPGTVLRAAGPLFVHSGVRPATGQGFYLATNGDWTTNETVYTTAAVSGIITNELPNPMEGEWQFEFSLRDPLDGTILAAVTQAFLVSSQPRLDLRVNRPIANTTDPVRLELLTSAGITNRLVKITASLTLPDGTELSLPSLASGLNYVYEGDATNTVFTLLDRYLERFGTGDYRVSVRLLDGNTLATLALADVGFQVCDTASVVSGVVLAANGQPLGGGNPTLALVTALDIDELTVTATAPIAADGSYTLSLVPGRYFISADVLDANGDHSATATNLVVIGCGSLGITLNLRESVAPSVPIALTMLAPKSPRVSTHVAPASTPPPASVNASDGLPKPSVYISYEFVGPLSVDEKAAAKQFASDFTGWVRTAAGPDVDFLSVTEVERVFQSVYDQQWAGTDPGETILVLPQNIFKEFRIHLTIGKVGSRYLVNSILQDLKNSETFRYPRQSGPAHTGGMFLQLASELGNGLFPLLRARQDRPLLPDLRVTVTPDIVQLGGSGATVMLSLKDRNGTPVPNQSISLTFATPSGHNIVNVQTTADGGVSTPVLGILSDTPPGSGRVTATFNQPRRAPKVVERGFRIVAPGAYLYLSSPHGGIHTGETEPVHVTLHSADSSPVAGATINLSAVGGTLSAPNVTTDGLGNGDFIFTAGNQSDVAVITATYEDTVNSNVVMRTYNLPLMILPNATSLLSTSATNVPGSSTASIVAEIKVGDARVPALPVEYFVEGGGSLSVTSSQTDDNGQADIIYLAPATGTGDSVITSIATVDGQRYTNAVTIHYEPAPLPPPAGMVLIPAGMFIMGNSVVADTDILNAAPVSTTVSAFYMDTNLVSFSQWQTVYDWAVNHGYSFVNAGAGKGASHPVHTVNWYDTVKWGNARSEQEGRTPVYYTDAGLTQVYKTGEVTVYANWVAGGYRLPTEAEWEKAARGGLSGKRFPLGDTISQSQANYYGHTSYVYDMGPNGYNSIGMIGGTNPGTSPVGSFPANGYGLYDMAGNLGQFCWDWYETSYAGGNDPHGPAQGSFRVRRGGYWSDYVDLARCAKRSNSSPSGGAGYLHGFRCVIGR